MIFEVLGSEVLGSMVNEHYKEGPGERGVRYGQQGWCREGLPGPLPALADSRLTSAGAAYLRRRLRPKCCWTLWDHGTGVA